MEDDSEFSGVNRRERRARRTRRKKSNPCSEHPRSVCRESLATRALHMLLSRVPRESSAPFSWLIPFTSLASRGACREYLANPPAPAMPATPVYFTDDVGVGGGHLKEDKDGMFVKVLSREDKKFAVMERAAGSARGRSLAKFLGNSFAMLDHVTECEYDGARWQYVAGA